MIAQYLLWGRWAVNAYRSSFSKAEPILQSIPCFSVAMFSVVAQFDMGAVGWYNSRIEPAVRRVISDY